MKRDERNFTSHLQTNPVFAAAAQAAEDAGYQAFVVGGYVRDLLLGKPGKDIDFVCVGSGIEWAKKVATILRRPPPAVFENFGTAMVKHDEYVLEFVGARKESYRTESRKPIVEDGTLEEDQKR